MVAAIQRINRAFPRFQLSVDVPKWADDGTIAARDFNRIVKESLKETLEWHHRLNIPKHFAPGAAQRYGYKARKEKWKRFKMRRWGRDTDLMATGRSRFRILNYKQIVIGGAAHGGKKGAEGKLIVKFDWAYKVAEQQRKKHAGGFMPTGGNFFFTRKGKRYTRLIVFQRVKPKAEVTAEQMKKEVAAMTTQERKDLARFFKNNFDYKMQQWRGQRKRIRRSKTR